MIYPADLIAPDKRLAEDERARQCKKLTPPGKAEGDTKSVTRADAVEPEKAAEPGPIWRSLALAQGRDDSHSPATTPTSTGSPLTSDRQPLDPLTRIYFEANFGRDFRNVRVHTGASAVQFVQDHSAGPLHSERTSTSRQTGIDRVLSTGKGC